MTRPFFNRNTVLAGVMWNVNCNPNSHQPILNRNVTWSELAPKYTGFSVAHVPPFHRILGTSVKHSFGVILRGNKQSENITSGSGQIVKSEQAERFLLPSLSSSLPFPYSLPLPSPPSPLPFPSSPSP